MDVNVGARRVVAALLVGWEPANFAVRGLQVLPTLGDRSWAASGELALHGVVAAFCVAAGMMLWHGAPDARRLAQAAIIVSAARVVQSIYWSALPDDTAPGDEWFYAGIAIGVAALLTGLLYVSGARPSERPSR